MLPTKFRFIWPSGYGGEDSLEINQSETRIVCGGHICKRIGTKWALYIEEFQGCFLPSFSSFGQAVSEENIFLNRPIRNKNGLWWPCLLMDRDKVSNLCRGPSIDASYQVSVDLAEGFQRRRLKCEKLADNKWWQKLTLARWNNELLIAM